MKSAVGVILAAVSVGLAAPALAIGDVDKGRDLVEATCQSCHVRELMPKPLNSPPAFREIIQSHKFTRNEFRRYVSQPHYPMPPRPLSLSQIEDLITYFDSAGYWP